MRKQLNPVVTRKKYFCFSKHPHPGFTVFICVGQKGRLSGLLSKSNFNMKIAIASNGNLVAEHFGQCNTFLIYTVATNQASEKPEMLVCQEGCACKSNTVSLFVERGVEVLLTGSMGQGALNKLNDAGIKVYLGCSGHIKDVFSAYLQGSLVNSEVTCQHHRHDHSCSH